MFKTISTLISLDGHRKDKPVLSLADIPHVSVPGASDMGSSSDEVWYSPEIWNDSKVNYDFMGKDKESSLRDLLK